MKKARKARKEAKKNNNNDDEREERIRESGDNVIVEKSPIQATYGSRLKSFDELVQEAKVEAEASDPPPWLTKEKDMA